MKLTIIPCDSFVAVDGKSFKRPLDLSTCGIPEGTHALQWFDSKGWIEFSESADPFTPKPTNEEITFLPDWANACVTKWNEAKVAQEAAILAAQQAAQS